VSTKRHMFISHCQFKELTMRGEPIVKGHIEIDGEFTQEEWNKIRIQFIAMGLVQGRQQRRKRLMGVLVPTRQQAIDAMTIDARNCNTDASDRLRAQYAIPDAISLDQFTSHYAHLLGEGDAR